MLAPGGMLCCWALECRLLGAGLHSLLFVQHKNSLLQCSNKQIAKERKLCNVNAQNTGHDHIRTQSEMDGLCRNELVQQFFNLSCTALAHDSQDKFVAQLPAFPSSPGVL
jgi:hypothetical protein